MRRVVDAIAAGILISIGGMLFPLLDRFGSKK